MDEKAGLRRLARAEVARATARGVARHGTHICQAVCRECNSNRCQQKVGELEGDFLAVCTAYAEAAVAIVAEGHALLPVA